MNNLPRRPVRFQEQNQELLKSQAGSAGQRKGTDYRQEEDLATVQGVSSSYRTPMGRECGNPFFRRYISGQLDVSYTVNKVVDALHRAKDSGGVDQLNSEEKAALGILFPLQFSNATFGSNMVGAVSAVQMRLGPTEVEMVRMAVAQKLQEILNYNAGRGGGSVPGRGSSRS